MADLFTLRQWETFEELITVRQPSTTVGVAGDPIDLTGATASGSVFKGWTATADYPFTFTIDTDPTTGKLTVSMEGAQTGLIPYGAYLFQITVRDSTEHEIFVLSGTTTVTPGRVL